MTYAPPSFTQLRDAVASDLRDPTYATFTKPQIGALVNEGIAELNRVRPQESVQDILLMDDVLEYPCVLQPIFLVEARRQNDPAWWPIEEQDYAAPVGTQAGWSLFAGVLRLPGLMTPLSTGFDQLRAWGYLDRGQLINDTDTADFTDMTDEEGCRCYARWTALEMLLHDRMLYQQWQSQTNNSDISTTQLLQTASSYQQEWSNLRKRLARLRRVA
jgi:hypothetical protein